jgi:hypothetical protein
MIFHGKVIFLLISSFLFLRCDNIIAFVIIVAPIPLHIVKRNLMAWHPPPLRQLQQPVLLLHHCIRTVEQTHSQTLGNITRIRIQSPSSDSSAPSVLEALGIQTFVCSGGGSLDHPQSLSDRTNDERLSATDRICSNVTWHNKDGNTNYNERFGPAFTVSCVLSEKECDDIISSCETAISSLEFETSMATSMNRDTTAAATATSLLGPIKNQHGAMQLVVSQGTADRMAQRVAPFIPIHFVEQRRKEIDWAQQTFNPTTTTKQQHSKENANLSTTPLLFVGLNRRFRIYKYAPNARDRFAPHIDAGFPPSGIQAVTAVPLEESPGVVHANETITTTATTTTTLVFDDTENVQSMLQQQLSSSSSSFPYTIQNVVSRLTILFYLNDNFSGGETNFYQPIHDTSTSSLSMLSNNNTAVSDDDDDGAPPPIIASVRPKTGMCLIFPQCVGADVMEQYAQYYWPRHEGSPVRPKHTNSTTTSSSSPKYVIRSDLLFAEISSDTDLPKK